MESLTLKTNGELHIISKFGVSPVRSECGNMFYCLGDCEFRGKVHGCPMRFQYPSPKTKFETICFWMCHTKNMET